MSKKVAREAGRGLSGEDERLYSLVCKILHEGAANPHHGRLVEELEWIDPLKWEVTP